MDLRKKHEDFICSEKTQEIKQRIESGFQGFDASGSSAPPRGTASAGRCNPQGVSYLYAALEEHTAIAEIRPFIKDSISVAVLRSTRDLKLVNFDFEPMLFSKYTDCVQEFQTISECLLFQNSFRLGARMMLEVMEE